jgi:hypothetical protein
MNIFYVDECPKASARALDDQRLVKMVLETAQLLSGAARLLLPFTEHYDGRGPRLYQVTHSMHPCAVFTRKTEGNFLYLVEYGFELCREYTHRFNRVHMSEAVIELACRSMMSAVKNGTDLAKGWPKAFTLSFNSSGFETGNLIDDYRSCMNAKWHSDSKPRWTRRGSPPWRVL